MTMDAGEQLEKDLAGLTRWPGGGTALWKQAMRSAGAPKPGNARGDSFWWRLVTLRLSNAALAGLALVCVFIAAGIMSLPQMKSAFGPRFRNRAVQTSSLAASNLRGHAHAMQIRDDLIGLDALGTDMWSVVRANNTTPRQFITPSSNYDADSAGFPALSPLSEHPLDRQVARNATMQLKTDNVRAAFAKVQHLVRPAVGEYVEQSSIAGQEENTTATLTLRVAADRLSEVLNQLRDLGTVVSEQQGGQDVTAQAVDLDARLRNEQRVETELLALLESRKDAPLKELLELRDSLGRVRSEIERLTGQREQLARLVSLASVLVILTAKDAADPAPPAEGLFAYFGNELGNAWRAGVYFLADTLTLMVRIIVGGAVFWVLLAVVVFMVKRRRNRTQAAPQ